MLSRTGGGAVLVGFGAAAALGMLAPPALAEPVPSPSGSPPSKASAGPTAGPTAEPTGGATVEPTVEPTVGPSQEPTEEPSEDPTEEPSPSPTPTPSDPPTGDPAPTDPPTGGEPSDPPADPAPGDPPPSQSPKTPVLSLRVSLSAPSVRPGGSLTATFTVKAAEAAAEDARLSVNAADVTVKPGSVGLGKVDGDGRTARVKVHVPSDARPGKVKLTAMVTAAEAEPVSRTFTFRVTGAPSGGGSGSGPGTGSGSAPSPPTGLPPQVAAPLTDSSAPIPTIRSPQVALPPVSAPRLAPTPTPTAPVAALRAMPEDGWEAEELAAIQAGWLAALTATGALVLVRVRTARRRELSRARRLFAGKRLTAARLRTLPPRPAGRGRGRAFTG